MIYIPREYEHYVFIQIGKDDKLLTLQRFVSCAEKMKFWAEQDRNLDEMKSLEKAAAFYRKRMIEREDYLKRFYVRECENRVNNGFKFDAQKTG